jgi:ferredoxin
VAEKGHGDDRCCARAPELFRADEFGKAMAVGDGDVPDDLEATTHLVIANGPEVRHRAVRRVTRS